MRLTTLSAADGKQVLTVVGSAAWVGFLVGDYVNTVGFGNATNGATLGVDFAWRVRSINTTTLELEALPGQTLPANFGTVNCGGALLRRTDVRISFVRVLDYDRLRIEAVPRPGNEAAGTFGVAVTNTPSVAISSGTVMTNAAPFAGTSGATAHLAISAATTNATSLKGSAGKCVGGLLVNTTAATKFFKFYNKATAPTVGTDTPVLTLPILANSSLALTSVWDQYGHYFATGIAYAITGAVANNDTTAVAAGDVIVNLLFV
ncbi:hypothetical protein [Caulobacter phage KSC]|uniref:Uncharacterized protein n=1 Tax=Caulobacter phage KSC TaxID=3020398 RepID=A0AAE9WYQ7_9CAUD|nr:hypothetical protein [Caulobacter phage KSC]